MWTQIFVVLTDTTIVYLSRTNLNKLPLNTLTQATVVPACDSITQRVEAGGLHNSEDSIGYSEF